MTTLVLLLAACDSGPTLGDHCTVSRGPDGDVRTVSEREMRGTRLVRSTLRFSIGGSAAGISENTFDDRLWMGAQFNGAPSEDVITGSTELVWDDVDPVRLTVYEEPAHTVQSDDRWTWLDGEVATHTTTSDAGTRTETWTWLDGANARVAADFDGTPFPTLLRTFRPNNVDWPTSSYLQDLPWGMLEREGYDTDDDGTIDALTFERTFDGDDLPVEETAWAANGDLLYTRTWGPCP